MGFRIDCDSRVDLRNGLKSVGEKRLIQLGLA